MENKVYIVKVMDEVSNVCINSSVALNIACKICEAKRGIIGLKLESVFKELRENNFFSCLTTNGYIWTISIEEWEVE